jgi:hypothetical protein
MYRIQAQIGDKWGVVPNLKLDTLDDARIVLARYVAAQPWRASHCRFGRSRLRNADLGELSNGGAM